MGGLNASPARRERCRASAASEAERVRNLQLSKFDTDCKAFFKR